MACSDSLADSYGEFGVMPGSRLLRYARSDECDLRDKVATPLNLDALTFAEFVAILEDPAVRAGNIHWRPQMDFLVYDRYDDYFAVENFAAAVAMIRDRAGLEVVDARPLTAHGLDP